MNETTTEARLLLRPIEAAEVLGVGRTTLFRLMNEGRLKSFTIGRSRRVHIEDLRQLAESLRRGEVDL